MIRITALILILISVLAFSSVLATPQHQSNNELVSEQKGTQDEIGKDLPVWSIIPFIGILLSIAIFPLVAPKFWHHHYPKVSFLWAIIFAIPFVIFFGSNGIHEIIHIYIIDYIPFIILLWGLYAVSGGILIRGSLGGTPKVNLVILIIGTLLASWMGTTGASMLLIRPLIRANKNRRYKVHTIIFFIFLVSNIGGSLTPLGDPPLFLGFLHGVPFFWTFHILPDMLTASGVLLLIYFILDLLLSKKEIAEKGIAPPKEKFRIDGLHNLIYLLGIMGAVLLSGLWKPGETNVFGVHLGIESVVRDVLILIMGMFSWWTTNKTIRHDNEFTWFPIIEVAYLFAGIFMTIIPALAMLKAGSEGHLAFIIEAVKEPYHYFWITGGLSSFLDNAPTYLTFFNLALGRLGIGDAQVTAILTGAYHGNAEIFKTFLEAISTGAVFFGAMTYIGNAPNFMVRSIAEEMKVKMPSFFGYMLWSIGILIPIFIIMDLIFF